MSKLQKNQSGFSAIEAILVLIIIGMLGFVGWYIWHAQQSANKNFNANTSTTPVYKKKTTTTTPTKSSTPTASTTSSNTFKISELGIKIINMQPSINDLTDYQFASNSSVDSNNTTKTPVKKVAVQFSTQSLTNADPACSAKDGTSIGMLGRTDGTYVNNGPIDNEAFVKQFSGFYITYSHPESSCSSKASAEALHASQTTNFQTLATNPANLQAL